MKKILLLLLFIPAIVSAADPDIIVRPFVNKSEYKGKWDIGNGFSKIVRGKTCGKPCYKCSAGKGYD